MDDDGDAAIRAAVEGEMALLDPAVRTSVERAAALLDDDFAEFGSSGRLWDRAELLAAMAGPMSLEGETVEVADVRGVRLADDLVHVTYRTGVGERASRRSSLWRRTGGRWRLYFHQGTPLAETTRTTRGAVLDHLAAFDAHDTDRLIAGLHPDVVWTTGTDVLRGTAAVRHLFDDGFWQLGPSLELGTLLVDGRAAAARMTERLLVNGRPERFPLAAFFTVVAGGIRTVTVYREGSAELPQ